MEPGRRIFLFLILNKREAYLINTLLSRPSYVVSLRKECNIEKAPHLNFP
jgi:hypothetical protein